MHSDNSILENTYHPVPSFQESSDPFKTPRYIYLRFENLFRMNNNIVYLLLATVLLLASCGQIDDLSGTTEIAYEAEYAVPIVNSEVSIQDFLEDFEENTTILVDPDGLLRFKYRGGIIDASVEQVFENINAALPPIIPILQPGMALPLSSPEGIQIDYLELKKGDFIYAFESEIVEPIEVTITMPQITKDGEPLTFQHSVEAFAPSSGRGRPQVSNALTPESLEGYTILPLNDSLYIDYVVVPASGDRSKRLTNFVIRLQDLEFTYAEGFLGTNIYEGGRDTIVIDFFDNWVQGDVFFEDPIVTFFINNSFGLPTKSLINSFDIFTVNEEKLPLESEFVQDGIEFPFPTLDQVGEIKTKAFVFTKENSNIAQILGAGPTAIDYDVDAVTNPEGNQGIRGFITDNSFYSVQVEVELPLYGNIANFAAHDTFDLNLDDFKDVNFAEFKLVTDNEIPLELDLQGYFVLDGGFVIDSLFETEQKVIAGAPVGPEGNPTGMGRSEVLIPFAGSRFESIKQAKQIIIRADFSTTKRGKQSVRIVNSQKLGLKMGAKLGVRN